MSVKISIVYDNRCDDCRLKEGWGFSALIEYAGQKILFDSGGEEKAFFSNAKQLNVSYQELNYLLFSHKHADHISGFKELIQKLPLNTTLCVPKTFPRKLIKEARAWLGNVKVIRSFQMIAPHVYSLALRGGFWLYEQALILKTPQGLGIVTGCAHPGVVSLIQCAQKHLQEEIAFVLGGFHMFSAPVKKRAQFVEQLKKLKIQKIAPCHCSGDDLIQELQEAYGDCFCKVGTGTILNF